MVQSYEHKTTAQRLLEAQRQKPIRDIMLESLERYRTRRTMVKDCCADLAISYGTFYKWVGDLNIDVRSYHTDAVAPGG